MNPLFKCSISYYCWGIYFLCASDISGNLYTLLMVDPDIPAILSNLGNSNQPLMHWMVVNILDGNVSLGEELHSYMGPLPPDDNPHYYYYFLFLQPWKLSLSNTEGFYSECGQALKGRFVFFCFCFVFVFSKCWIAFLIISSANLKWKYYFFNQCFVFPFLFGISFGDKKNR